MALILLVPSASASSYVYEYSTVDYDSGTDTATGYSYTSWAYGGSLYYEPYVTATMYDEDGNYLTDATQFQGEGGAATVTLPITGYGCQDYRMDGWHGQDAFYYYVTNYNLGPAGFFTGYYDRDGYTHLYEGEPIPDPLTDAQTAYATGPVSILEDEMIFVGVTETTGHGSCTLPTVVIKRNNTPITTTQTVSVGEQIALTTAVSSGTPTSPSWSIPGNKVADYQVLYTNETSATSGLVTQLTNLAQTGETFYWVDGGDGRNVTYTCKIGGHHATATATFNVKRPTSTMSATTSAVTLGNEILNGTNTFGLWLGHPEDPSPTQGISFAASLTSPTGMSGHWYFVQKLNSTSSSVTPLVGSQLTESGVGLLDTNFPYDKTDTDDGLDKAATTDNPGVPLSLASSPCDFTQVAVNDSFSMYLMYRPTVGGSSIDVPLRKIDWSFVGSGTTSSCTGVASWSLSNASPSTATSKSSSVTNEFPEWISNVKGLTFH